MCVRRRLQSAAQRPPALRALPPVSGAWCFYCHLFFVLFFLYQKWLCDQTDSEKITKKKIILGVTSARKLFFNLQFVVFMLYFLHCFSIRRERKCVRWADIKY